MLFDRGLKALHRSRRREECEYLLNLTGRQILDRFEFLKRDYKSLLDLGCGNRYIHSQIGEKYNITETDLSPPRGTQYVDEERIPFKEGSMDAVLSNLSLHWVNELPSTLTQIRKVLKADSPFIGCMFGGDTLFELRTSLQLAEQERRGGISPRISPMTHVKDIGSLLNRAGFKLTTIDTEDIVVDYPDIFALMGDLNGMGESNAITARQEGPIARDVLAAASGIYGALHGNKDGTIPATFHVIYMIGWAPSVDTPKPLERGSGRTRLKDVL